ncbi:MAG: DUF4417 domain-containing protein [Bacteroidales bacterium]|nr:DUF4417 domain-containing protein [Bacteroidales bacterium]
MQRPFVQDRIFASNNPMEIPTLLLDMQPKSGLLLPFAGWGTMSRSKTKVSTYHFYVDDYRFEAIWKDPAKVVMTGSSEVVEPNFSLFQTTPIAFGIHQIYRKRWIARWLQECGVRVWADLNVAPKFQEYNRMGIPEGYNAFFTVGHENQEEVLAQELQIAKEISGVEMPNLIVYGGGRKIKSWCQSHDLLYVESHVPNIKPKN